MSLRMHEVLRRSIGVSITKLNLNVPSAADLVETTVSRVRSALTRRRSFLLSESSAGGVNVWQLVFAKFQGSGDQVEEFWLPRSRSASSKSLASLRLIELRGRVSLVSNPRADVAKVKLRRSADGMQRKEVLL